MMLYAQQQAQGTNPASGQGTPVQTPGMGSLLIPMILILGIFYLLIYLPAGRQRKKHQAMLSALKGGERVITSGGIYGTVTRVLDDRFEVQIDGNTKIQVTKNSIAAVLDLTQGDKAK